MHRLLLWLLYLSAPVAAQAQAGLTREADFFGLADLDALTISWFYDHLDSTLGTGVRFPTDIELLRLSPSDYRMAMLDAFDPHLLAVRINPSEMLLPKHMRRSGSPPDTCRNATAMCLMQSGAYFNPQSDRVAVTFQYGATIGIYQFSKWTNEFTLDRTMQSAAIRKPIGIYWAFQQFFIVDEDSQRVFRTDEYGSVIAEYGSSVFSDSSYFWLTDISGYVDGAQTAHLYVADGMLGRIDHLTTTATSPVVRHSVAWPMEEDSFRLKLHAVSLIPGVGPVAFNRYTQTLYSWETLDTIRMADRNPLEWPDAEEPVRMDMWAVGGRLVVASLDSTDGGWGFRSYKVGNAQLDNPVLIPPDHWPTQISPVVVTDSFRISSGDTLVIDAGVDVEFDDDAALFVEAGGTLLINGTASDPVQFGSWETNEVWSGITCYGKLNMSYVEMLDCDDHSVYIYKPDSTAVIDHCTFTGNKLAAGGDLLRVIGSPGAGGKTAWVTNTTITTATLGRGLYLSECDVKFTNVEVTKCAYANTYLNKVTGVFKDCTFSYPASYQGIVIASSVCTPHFECCTFEDLAPDAVWPATVYCLPVVGPTFGYEGASEGISNVFNDSSTALLKFSHLGTVNPIIDNVNVGGGTGGRNDWYQRNSRGRFLSKSGMSSAFPAQDQYWNHTGVTVPGDTSFAPSTSGSYDCAGYGSSPWDLCGGMSTSLALNPAEHGRGSGLDDGGANLDSLFAVALQAEHDEDYANAQAIFHSVAVLGIDPELRWQATTHVLSTQRHLDAESGETWIPAQIESGIAADSARYESYVYGRRLLASYRTDRGQYDDAIGVYNDLFAYGLTTEDSLSVALELVSLQLLMDGGGGHLDAGGAQIPSALRVRSHAEAFALEKHLLDAFITLEARPEISATIPTTFKLHQNYPNPFNPSTEIAFDLPSHERVQLRIYNTLGQEVVTLIDEQRQAGSYRALWNGKSVGGLDVASGVYIYQLKAGRYLDAKKMVLIR